jgi:competence protein ComEC
VLSFFGDVFVINFLYDQLIIHLLKLIHFFAQADFLFFEDIPMSLLEVILLFVLLYLLRFLIKERRIEGASVLFCGLSFLFAETRIKYSCFS